MKQHEHKRPAMCSCDIQGLEPDEECPVHGYGEFPPRCEMCGQFMKWVGSVPVPDATHCSTLCLLSGAYEARVR